MICRAQIMEEDIPWESHDVVMNAVVSECGVLRIR